MRYYAILKKDRLRSVPAGTWVQLEQPSEDYGGYERDYKIYVYYLDLKPGEYEKYGKITRLTEEMNHKRIKNIEVIMTLNELNELECENGDSESC